MRRLALASVLLALPLAGCSDGGDDGDSKPRGPENFGAAEESEEVADPMESTEVLEAGFGQDPESPEYVRAMVIVGSTGEAAVGRFVEVSVNFLDAAGGLLATETQTESFTWPDQSLVLPVFAQINDGAAIDSIDVSYTLSDHTMGDEGAEPLESVTADEVRAGEYGGTEAVFTLSNPTDASLEDLRIGVVCRDANDAIIGGTDDYPGAIAPGGQILVETDVTVSALPATCEAFPNYGF